MRHGRGTGHGGADGDGYVSTWSPEDLFVSHPVESVVEVMWLDPYAPVDAKVDLQTQRANTRVDIQGVPVDLTC